MSTERFHPTEANTKDLFKPTEGFLIPEYQRPYSWKKDNIIQLFEDICTEAKDYIEAFNSGSEQERNALRFLGTVIQTKQDGSDYPIKYPRATPQTIVNVVDGQQRLSTVVLIFLALFIEFEAIKATLGEEPLSITLKGILERKNREILDLISIELGGKPNRKPRIIRAETDRWTFDGNITNYKSGPSYAVAKLLDCIETNDLSIDALRFIKSAAKTNDELVGINLKVIEDVIRQISQCHQNGNYNPTVDDAEIPFPSAIQIDGLGAKLNNVWYDSQEELRVILRQQTHNLHETVASVLQLMYFCYFLMNRCYFVSIVAPDDDRAFDMFQSLNTTGTPLTAIETFRPMAARELREQGRGDVDQYFKSILEYFETIEDNKTADIKVKTTNTLLSHFAYINSAYPLNKTFSNQRRWLQKKFSEGNSSGAKESFISRLAGVAKFLEALHKVKKDDATDLEMLDTLGEADRQLATFNTVFLDDAGNDLGITILARFYERAINGATSYQRTYLDVTKIVVAFFVLWRSASLNTGLDDAYRRVLGGETDSFNKTKKYTGVCWEDTGDIIDIEILRRILLNELERKNLLDKQTWMNRAKARLNYEDAKRVCKFILLLVSHNRDASVTQAGLWGEKLRDGSEDHLTASYYRAKKHHTIEHIAPDHPTPTSQWDSHIYAGSSLLRHSIGNLTLLPTEINSEMGNKSWPHKWIYFWQVGSSSMHEPKMVRTVAAQFGVSMDEKIASRLAKTESFVRANAPIAKMDPNKDDWNVAQIEARRDQILDISWEILYEWLGVPNP